MDTGFTLFPTQASTFAADVDALYFFVIAVSAFFALVVAVAVIIFGVKYRRRHEGEVGARIEGNLALELLWSVIPTIITTMAISPSRLNQPVNQDQTGPPRSLAHQ